MANDDPAQSDYSTTFGWPDSDGGPYTVTVYFDVDDGRPQCVGVEIRGTTQTPITATSLRLPLGRLIDESRRQFIKMSESWLKMAEHGPVPPGFVQEAEEMQSEWGGKIARARRPLYGDDHWTSVADVYRAAWVNGDPPTLAVADHWHVSKSTAAKWVAKARNEFHLLPATDKGKASATAAHREA